MRLRLKGATGGLRPIAICVVVASIVSGCVAVTPVVIDTTTQNVRTVNFQQVPVSSIWTDEPSSLIALQRDFRAETEQLIALENNTTMRGDNFLLIVARKSSATQSNAFKLQDFVTRAGGVPSPFTKISDANLMSGTDSLGDYFWLEYKSGGVTNCVLAVRRVGFGARALPRNAQYLDVMLRNCVAGSIEQALNPIGDNYLGALPSRTGLPTGDGASRLLSPLAGPTR